MEIEKNSVSRVIVLRIANMTGKKFDALYVEKVV